MPVTTWIVAVDANVADLVTAARSISDEVIAAIIGPRAVADEVAHADVDQVLSIDPGVDQVAEAVVAQAADAIAARRPDVVLMGPQEAARLVGGRLAALTRAPLITGVQQVTGPKPVARRLTVSGSVEQTVSASPLLAVLDASGSPIEPGGAPSPVASLDVESNETGLTRASSSPRQAGADLGSADRVVAVGRGLAAKTDLGLVEQLAATLGAQLGGSLPLAEDLGWLDKELCIGISGKQISPALYVAVGISGQMQHMAGVTRAQKVVAINNDPEALVFGKSDFGIVGDLYEVVPALISALAEA